MAVTLKKAAVAKAVPATHQENQALASLCAELMDVATKVGAARIKEANGGSPYALLNAARDAVNLVREVDNALIRFERNL